MVFFYCAAPHTLSLSIINRKQQEIRGHEVNVFPCAKSLFKLTILLVVWTPNSCPQLLPSVHPSLLPPPQPLPPLVSAPTACYWPTALLADWGYVLCRSPCDTKGSPRWAARFWPGTWSPGTPGRKCACSGAPWGSGPCVSRGRGRRYTHHPHTEPWWSQNDDDLGPVSHNESHSLQFASVE